METYSLHDLAKASGGYDRLSMNELRARLYAEGKVYPEDATRQELIDLIEGKAGAGE